MLKYWTKTYWLWAHNNFQSKTKFQNNKTTSQKKNDFICFNTCGAAGQKWKVKMIPQKLLTIFFFIIVPLYYIISKCWIQFINFYFLFGYTCSVANIIAYYYYTNGLFIKMAYYY